MELQDFAIFLMAPVLLIPFVSIYFCLKFIIWDTRGRKFLYVWYLWLTWLLSAVLTLFLLALIDANTGVFLKFSKIGFIFIIVSSVFIVNTLAIAGLVKILSAEPDDLHLFEGRARLASSRPPAFRISLITTIAATSGLVISFGLASAVGSVYEHYCPKPKTEFELYDI